MAIFHFSVKIFSRSKGRSAIAAAAYRHALRLRDERTGLVHDFRRKSGVTHSEVAAPIGTPGWIMERSKLWNEMERAEKRRDAQLCREIEIALPAELAEPQRLALVRGWVKEQLTDRGIIADIAIHTPGGAGDHRNHHAHIMTTLRRISGGKIGPKVRDWGNRQMIFEWRQSWAEHCNRHLEVAGIEARVDHRSLRAQGIERIPTTKIGQSAMAIDRKIGRVVSERGRLKSAVAAQNRLNKHQRVVAARKARQAIARELSHFMRDSLVLLAGVDPYERPKSVPELLLDLAMQEEPTKSRAR